MADKPDLPPITSPALAQVLAENRQRAANKPTPAYTEAAPMSAAEISRQLREAGVTAAETAKADGDAFIVEGKKRLQSPLQQVFPIISSGAFILYLQGPPDLPSAAALEALTLDSICTTLGLLKFKPLHRSGKGKNWSPEALAYLDKLASDCTVAAHRLELTSKFYQTGNKAGHIDYLHFLTGLGVPLQMQKVAHRAVAEEAVAQWKSIILQWMAVEGVTNPSLYLQSLARNHRVQPLSASELKDALSSL